MFITLEKKINLDVSKKNWIAQVHSTLFSLFSFSLSLALTSHFQHFNKRIIDNNSEGLAPIWGSLGRDTFSSSSP